MFKKNLSSCLCRAMAIGSILALATSCGQVFSGTYKELNSGLTTTYRNIKPDATLMVMNDVVIRHSDIPLGEKFTIINQGVQGLAIRDGKFSAGCSLVISDANDRILLNHPDLFAGNDVWDDVPDKQLKCTIFTGSPMKWDEEYFATVTFWDKYGDGVLTNKVKVRMMDIP